MTEAISEVPDSNAKVFRDTVFSQKNSQVQVWKGIKELYPDGANQPLLPQNFSSGQFAQGTHYECSMLSTLASFLQCPDVIRKCFVTKNVRQDGRYTFQFFRGKEWVKVEIDDRIAMDGESVMFVQSPTEHWWPLLLEKAYAKFYTSYESLEGCTLQETFHDLTGLPSLSIPLNSKLAKTAGFNLEDVNFWLTLGDLLTRHEYVAGCLTKTVGLERIGLQSEQQYAILAVISLNMENTMSDLVVKLYSPFEDDCYMGPLNKDDKEWSELEIKKYDVRNPRFIHIPLKTFVQLMNSLQICLMSQVEADATYFQDEWKGESAGGNPTFISWRNNPMYMIRNTSDADMSLVASLKQEDQRRFTTLKEPAKYSQCGMVLVRNTQTNPMPTLFVTGNNHKTLYKSLFLDSREVSNLITIPPNSLCYLVPSTINKGTNGKFTLALYRMKNVDYSKLSITKLEVPGMEWNKPAKLELCLQERGKARVDFSVAGETQVHILLLQKKSFSSKQGGDAMAQDFAGLYLYNSEDKRIGGVDAATNFREVGLVYSLPAAGRYAVSVTCPQSIGEVPCTISIVGSTSSQIQIVPTPEKVQPFHDPDVVDDAGGDYGHELVKVDYDAARMPAATVTEVPEGDAVWEDLRFYSDNAKVADKWVRICDLYPDGKKKALIPDSLDESQFEQGNHFECGLLTAFSTLVERHSYVLRNCFVSKRVRKDGRYTFRFHRYGEWVKVEIDDRIPMAKKKETLFSWSPTQHWWPLLLEKAYAKFYTLYQNVEGITQEEIFYDFTGRGMLVYPLETELAIAAKVDIKSVNYWMHLQNQFNQSSVFALSKKGAKRCNLQDEQYYGILGVYCTKSQETCTVQDVLVKLFNPYEESKYTGPMHSGDSAWTSDLKKKFKVNERHLFYMPLHVFLTLFRTLHIGDLQFPPDPRYSFFSEWDENTNGGMPLLTTWRKNPLYLVRNENKKPLNIMAMISLPDRRHVRHTGRHKELGYPQIAVSLAQASPRCTAIPTHLVTMDNHTLKHVGLFLSKRDVASRIIVPSRSLCYLIGSCMSRELGKFMMSFWYEKEEMKKVMHVSRYVSNMDLDSPATAKIILHSGGRSRLDFLVSCPTDVHLLVCQEKPFAAKHGGDVVTEDHIGAYIYNSNDRLIRGAFAAVSYREVSLVTHLPEPGRYAATFSCPKGTPGDIPCHVEVVCHKDAHIQVTDTPAGAKVLREVDLAFMDQYPEGIPLTDLPLDSDAKFLDLVEILKNLEDDPNADPNEMAEVRDAMNMRAHQLAKDMIGALRPEYLNGIDLVALKRVLDLDPIYMDTERKRFIVAQDPDAEAELVTLDKILMARAKVLNDSYTVVKRLEMLDDMVLGIKKKDLHCEEDDTFADMMAHLTIVRLEPDTKADAIRDLEQKMRDFALAVAEKMHTSERGFLDEIDLGIPWTYLNLNDDEEYCRLEALLRALLADPNADPKEIEAVRALLLKRLQELALAAKERLRAQYFDESMEQNRDLLLADAEFCQLEDEMIRLMMEDPEGNADAILELQQQLRARAAFLIDKNRKEGRGFIKDCGIDPRLLEARLSADADFCAKEIERRKLLDDPVVNAAKIKALEDSMMEDVVRHYEEFRKAERHGYLQSSYYGRSIDSLPLSADKEFSRLEEAYLLLRLDPDADENELNRLREAMDTRAGEIAKSLNTSDRGKYLPAFIMGIPVDQLGVDEDEEFLELESRRALLLEEEGVEEDIAKLEKELLQRAQVLARALNKGMRSEYLPSDPEGIPLSLLELDSDEVFTAREYALNELHSENDAEKNGQAILSMQETLKQMVVEMGVRFKAAQIMDCVDENIRVLPLPLASNEQMIALYVARGEALKRGDEIAAKGLAQDINAKAHMICGECIKAVRSHLEPSFNGVELNDIPFAEDDKYLKLERQAMSLMRDPEKNKEDLEELFVALNDRVSTLAHVVCKKERLQFLEHVIEGRDVLTLPLDEDGKFVELEGKRRELLKDKKADPAAIAATEKQLVQRATELSRMCNMKERGSYLDATYRGIPMESLLLNDDEDFHTLEVQHSRMKQTDAPKEKLKELEKLMSKRADAVAIAVLRADRKFMDQTPEGIPLEQLLLEEDSAFVQLEQRRGFLKATGGSNEDIHHLEEQMDARAHEIAKEANAAIRSKLNQKPQGIPIKDIPLNKDAQFLNLEGEYRKAMKSDNKTHATSVLGQLNRRLNELANIIHEKEHERLYQTPNGIPLSELPTNTDPQFLKLEDEYRLLAKDPAKNSTRMTEIDKELNARALELAKALRQYVADLKESEIPLELLSLHMNKEYMAIEATLLAALKDPFKNKDQIEELRKSLQEIVYRITEHVIKEDRGFLDENPGGIPLEETGFEKDSEFHVLEVERTKLRLTDPEKNAQKMGSLEEKMNERCLQLAEKTKEKDLQGLDKAPRGIPLRILQPHDDKKFANMASDLRSLLREENQEAVAPEVARLREEMNARCHKLAADRVLNDRNFIKKDPLGVSLEILPINEDAAFLDLESRRTNLKAIDAGRNAAGIKDLEQKINDRVVELAQMRIDQELHGLDQKPMNIPLKLLKPYEDPTVAECIKILRKSTTVDDSDADVAELKRKMNDRMHEVARSKLEGDRGYLTEDPKGVPLRILSLDADEKFRALELQRAIVKLDNPVRNAAKIKELEDELDLRALELAQRRLEDDLVSVDKTPRGIAIELLDPHSDGTFSALVVKRRACELSNNPEDKAAVGDVIAKMNDRLHELAGSLLEGDRSYLTKDPHGVPLAVLHIDNDEEFRALECQRAVLKAQNAQKNTERIHDLEEKLNARVLELATEQMMRDVDGLPKTVREIPLSDIKPHEDKEFAGLVTKLRALKEEDPAGSKNVAEVEKVQKAMQARVDAIAAVALSLEYLESNPDGVPLEDLPLETDPVFHELQLERATLNVQDSRKNAAQIQALEEKLTTRAHDLSKLRKDQDIEGISDTVRGIPKDILGLHADEDGARIITQLRAAQRDFKQNEPQIKELEEKLSKRAAEIAYNKLDGDRDYLDPYPLGIPLEDVLLLNDEEFNALEVERVRLKASNVKNSNSAAIRTTECLLNERCIQLAQKVQENDLRAMPKKMGDTAVRDLTPHKDKVFAEAANLYRLQKRDPDASPNVDTKKLMEDRLAELAEEKALGELYFLKPNPKGVHLDELPLATDNLFQQMKLKREDLRQQNPLKHREAILKLEADMNACCDELALKVLDADFSGLNQCPMDVPLALLHPREDEVIKNLIPELRRANRTQNLKSRAMDISVQMDERAHKLAKLALEEGRAEYLDPLPEGVPLRELDLGADKMFHELESVRCALRLMDARKNALQMKEVEVNLNMRAHELAKEQLAEDVSAMPAAPLSIPLATLHPDKDPKLATSISEMRVLKKDPLRNAEKIRALQTTQRERVEELALNLLVKDRAYLDTKSDLVSLKELPLLTDSEFHTLEVQRAVMKDRNQNTAELEKKLNERVQCLVQEQLDDDLAGLTKAPLGVPLELLKPHKDTKFFTLVQECRRLKKEVTRSGAIKEVRDRMDARCHELAEEYLAQDRLAYMDEVQRGIPLANLNLTANEEFKQLEDRKLALMAEDGNAHKDEISAIEEEIANIADKVAVEELRADRAYLDASTEGVDIRGLALEDDAEFRSLEAQRAAAKAKHSLNLVEELEEKLNKRMLELAIQQKKDDTSGLNQAPRGIPLELLRVHDDPALASMVSEMRELRKNPSNNQAQISALLGKMDARAHAIADAVLKCDRGFLPTKPMDIPARRLPLDVDETYHSLEAERAALKLEDPKRNATRIAKLEERMKERMLEMAKELKKNDCMGLEAHPCGIPILLLDPHKNEKFAVLLDERAKLPSAQRNSPDEPVVRALNRMLQEMAEGHLSGDRDYLHREPNGVHINILPLSQDGQFCSMEVERAILKIQDPVGNAQMISDLEDQLNKRAAAMAQELLVQDRHFLDLAPLGVQLSELPLDTDNKVHALEVERSKLKARGGDDVNADRIYELEAQIKQRTIELAKMQLEDDVRGLDRDPCGYPLSFLNPHKDEQFSYMVNEIRHAKKNDPSSVPDLQRKMNDRAMDLAKARILADRLFLDKHPQGVPLDLIPIETDNYFRSAEKELRSWKAAPTPNEVGIADAQNRMSLRANELARDLIRNNRDFLDAEPDGIKLDDVPLDTDNVFRAKEIERLRILADPKRRSTKDLAILEVQLNDRAHELARATKRKYREFLKPHSSGIPKDLLAIDVNAEFVKNEKELVHLTKNPSLAAPNQVEKLKATLQLLADDIAEHQVKGHRDRYLLDVHALGVEFADLNLEEDEMFMRDEVERAIRIATDHQANKDEIHALEDRLNSRALDLGRTLIKSQRAFLAEEFLGIPTAELPLDTDDRIKKMERQLRLHTRGNQRDEVARDQEDINHRCEQLAEDIVRQDLSPLSAGYRGISKEELNLHSDAKFRILAGQARKDRNQGRGVDARPEILEQMDRRAAEIADAMINEQRAFLDQEPEGMYLEDVPLDDDAIFMQLESEYRRRMKDPRARSGAKDAISELQNEMNHRSHILARGQFQKMRGFLDQEPEAILLIELDLDSDPQFKEAEVTRYRNGREAHPNQRVQEDTARRMTDRTYQIARTMLAADRGFLEQEPEGVPLSELPLDTDVEFCEMARERRRRKRGQRKGFGEDEVQFCEDRMNVRVSELAREFLTKNRFFLDREPEGVPLEDLALNTDAQFRTLEKERLKRKRDKGCSPDAIATLEARLNDRAHGIANEFLRKERSFLDPSPMGVALEDLPLNHDKLLNPMERRCRAMRKDFKRYHEEIRATEYKISERVDDIALSFIESERDFLNPHPLGVPLRYVPLNSDEEFHSLEMQRRQLMKRSDSNREEIASLEKRLNDRSHVLARKVIEGSRHFLHVEPLGVPLADVPLNEDETFRRMEEHRRVLMDDPRNQAAVRDIENRLNDRVILLTEELLARERASMNPNPFGVRLEQLPLNEDRQMRDIERARRHLVAQNDKKNGDAIYELEKDMDRRAYELALKMLEAERGYLDPEPRGVPLVDLPLETDSNFHRLELEHHQLINHGRGDHERVAEVERLLNERALQLADEFIRTERSYLDQNPVGIPLVDLPLDNDYSFRTLELERRQMMRSGENLASIADVEQRLHQRLYDIAREVKGWQDDEFFQQNHQVAEEWPRISQLYPEGCQRQLDPEYTSGEDVDSAPGDAGYLAPFIAALGRHPVLLKRLIASRDHPVLGPYSFIFFDPNSNPVYVDIDDRVPCDPNLVPRYTRSPNRSWYPLLIEKAYAKFVGGYERLDDCTPHETLRDLTGRPVTHIPFDLKLAAAANIGDYTSVAFWRGVSDDLARGDVIMCLSKSKDALDGIHPQCSYALMGVIDTMEGSMNPSDIVIKLHNTYRSSGPYYDGPLCSNDPNWTEHLRRLCRADPEGVDAIFMPLPTFLRNFSSMQSCHINCGDRLTAVGGWERISAGGNPKYTSFRNNPIYLVENKSSRAAVILAEVRHNAPTLIDEGGLSHYPQTGIVLMQPLNPAMPPTPLITNSTHQFLQKGMMLDSREVCSVMELPPCSTCYLMPYTMKPGQSGSFNLSVYPGMAKVTLTPLHNAGLSREPVMTRLTLVPGDEGRRVDFMVGSPADIHVLLHQDKISDEHSVRRGDTIAEDDVVMSVFTEQGTRLGSSGDATNAREHSLVFKADKPGRYALLLTSPNQPMTGDCPCTLSIYSSKKTTVKFVPPPVGARPLQQTRFPQLPKTAPERRGQWHRAASRNSESNLPPLRQLQTNSAASSRYSRNY